MQKRSKAILITLLLLLIVLFSVISVNANYVWHTQTVDENTASHGGGYCSLVLDSNNNPHTFFTETHLNWKNEPIYTVRYAKIEGSGWSNQTIGEGIAYSLALDANDNPHLVYGAIDHQGPLMYASWTEKNWTTQTVYPYDTGYASIAVDSNGKPHVAFIDNKKVKYASWTGSNWSIQAFDEIDQNDYSISLALDSNDNPTIAYYISDTVYMWDHVTLYSHSACLKIAVYRDSNWKIQNLTEMDGDLGNLVLDSKSCPHLIYSLEYSAKSSSGDNCTLVYASWDGTAWDRQTVFTNDYLDWMSLALDSHNEPHIVYCSMLNLTYTSLTSDGWQKQIVNNSTGGSPDSLTLDSGDQPHIIYRAVSNLDSIYIVNLMYTTTSETVQASPSILMVIVASTVTVVVLAGVGLVFFVRRKKLSKEPMA